MMHKEVVERKKTHVLVITLLFVTFMLYVLDGIEALKIPNAFILRSCNIAVFLITLALVVAEYFSCRISYKYSIIADKLIINRIFRGNETNLESIKINNIVYIGKKCNIPKEYKKKCNGSYGCDMFKYDSLWCAYQKDDKKYIFSFQPSEDLVKRIAKRINI